MGVTVLSGDECRYDPVIADLLWETDPELFGFIHQSDQQAWRGLCEAEWEADVGLHSKNRTTLALRDGEVVGLVVRFAGADVAARTDATITRLLRGLPNDRRDHVTRALAAMGWLFPVVPDQALYIYNLAVLENARGLGIGKKLVDTAIDAARREGLSSIHLDTATNRPAVAFYEKLGFAPLVETRLCQLRDGESVPTHYRMILPIH